MLQSIYSLNIYHLFHFWFQTDTLRCQGIEPESVALEFELTAAIIDPVNKAIRTALTSFSGFCLILFRILHPRDVHKVHFPPFCPNFTEIETKLILLSIAIWNIDIQNHRFFYFGYVSQLKSIVYIFYNAVNLSLLR